MEKWNRVRVLHGKYAGRDGHILCLKQRRHRILFADGFIGWVLEKHCKMCCGTWQEFQDFAGAGGRPMTHAFRAECSRQLRLLLPEGADLSSIEGYPYWWH